MANGTMWCLQFCTLSNIVHICMYLWFTQRQPIGQASEVYLKFIPSLPHYTFLLDDANTMSESL